MNKVKFIFSVLIFQIFLLLCFIISILLWLNHTTPLIFTVQPLTEVCLAIYLTNNQQYFCYYKLLAKLTDWLVVEPKHTPPLIPNWPLNNILSLFNPVYIFTTYFSNIHLNIIIPFPSLWPKWLISKKYFHQKDLSMSSFLIQAISLLYPALFELQYN